jgi:hypothetical protein
MYADDTKMASVINEKKDWKALQQELKFNNTKCKVCIWEKQNECINAI